MRSEDGDSGGQWEEISRPGGGENDARLLQAARPNGAERAVWEEDRQRGHPLDRHRAGHLELSRQAVHEGRSVRGVTMLIECVKVDEVCQR